MKKIENKDSNQKAPWFITDAKGLAPKATKRALVVEYTTIKPTMDKIK